MQEMASSRRRVLNPEGASRRGCQISTDLLGGSMFARAYLDSLLRNNPFELAPDGSDAVVSLLGLLHLVALRQSQVMDPRKNELEWSHHQLVNTADLRSYDELLNTFAELEPDYVEHYRMALGHRVWLVGPLAYAGEASAQRSGDASVLEPDADSCLRWLDEKPGGSVDPSRCHGRCLQVSDLRSVTRQQRRWRNAARRPAVDPWQQDRQQTKIKARAGTSGPKETCY